MATSVIFPGDRSSCKVSQGSPFSGSPPLSLFLRDSHTGIHTLTHTPSPHTLSCMHTHTHVPSPQFSAYVQDGPPVKPPRSHTRGSIPKAPITEHGPSVCHSDHTCSYVQESDECPAYAAASGQFEKVHCKADNCHTSNASYSYMERRETSPWHWPKRSTKE